METGQAGSSAINTGQGQDEEMFLMIETGHWLSGACPEDPKGSRFIGERQIRLGGKEFAFTCGWGRG